MELWKRCAALFVGGTVIFVFMAEMMKFNGDARPKNAGWLLISTIRNIFLGAWVLLLGGAVILFVINLVVEAREAREKAERTKQHEEEQRKDQIAREWRWIKEEKERLNLFEKHLNELEAERRLKHQAKQRELEERQARTTDEAVDRALEDFG